MITNIKRANVISAVLMLVPIALSLVLTALLLVLLQQDPVQVFSTIWEGAFKDTKGTAVVVNFWIPLTLASAGLVISFKAGLWNIGVEGQIVMGAIFASGGALFISLPRPLLILVCLLLAMLGGLLWALLVGVLKTRFGVHEIFGGVALNAIANNIAIYLITGPWQPLGGGNGQSTAPFPLEAWLYEYSPDFPVPLVMLILTLLSSAVVFVILHYSRWGLELKAVGKNARSALLLGVPTEGVSLLALVFCGSLAGLAGAHRVLHSYHTLRPLVSGGIGFLALLVVLLVGFRVLIVPFVAFVTATLFVGSARLKILLQLDQSLVGILQGLVVLLVLLFDGIRSRWFSPKLEDIAHE